MEIKDNKETDIKTDIKTDDKNQQIILNQYHMFLNSYNSSRLMMPTNIIILILKLLILKSSIILIL